MKPTVFVIGDSISLHYGVFLEQYLKDICKYYRKQGNTEAFKNLDIPAGANGGDSSRVLSYLESNSVHNEIPFVDCLLINCGLHDIKTDPITSKKQISEQEYKQNLIKILKNAKKLSKQVCWIRTTPCDETVHNSRNKNFHRFHKDCIRYNAIADEIMISNNIPIIDLYNFTLTISDNLYCDHVHFNKDIREKQAAFITGWLFNQLRE